MKAVPEMYRAEDQNRFLIRNRVLWGVGMSVLRKEHADLSLGVLVASALLLDL